MHVQSSRLNTPVADPDLLKNIGAQKFHFPFGCKYFAIREVGEGGWFSRPLPTDGALAR